MAAPAEESKEEQNENEIESKVEEEESAPIKPGMARHIKLYLVDPERFVIEWATPQRMGHPLPLRYDIEINGHLFEGALSQHQRPKNEVHFEIDYLSQNPYSRF